MLLKSCLLHEGIVLPRHAIFCIFFSMFESRSAHVLFMWSIFSIVIFILITINHEGIGSLVFSDTFYRVVGP